MHDSTKRPPLGVRFCIVLVVAGLTELLLSGCVGAPAPTPTATTSDAAEPIFASDEEALAAAVEAYEAYIAVSQQIGEDGGSDPERILAVATREYADEVVSDFESMSAQGLKVIGANSLDTTSLIEHSEEAGAAQVSIYGCVGVGTTQIVDESGNDLTPAERSNKVPLVLNFVSAEVPGVLILSGSDLWSGDDFC